MKVISALGLGLFFFSVFSGSPEKHSSVSPPDWQAVDSLESIGKIESALKITESILENSWEVKDRENYLRAVIYQTAYVKQLFPDQPERVIDRIESETHRSGEVMTAVLESILGEFYMMYFYENRWRIQSRSTAIGDRSEDIDSWSTGDFLEQSSEHFLNSLESNLTAEVSNESLGWVIESDSLGLMYRPGLRELLLFRALDFFSTAQQLSEAAVPSVVVNREFFFSPAADFVELDMLELADGKKDFSYRVLSLYQKGIEWALENNQSAFLADLELRRIRFLKSVCRGVHCDSFYLNALKELYQKFSDIPIQSEIIFYIAEHYKRQGDRYSGNPADPNRLAYTIAMEWAEKGVEAWPRELRSGRNENLILEISHRDLQFDMENVNGPDEEFLISLAYRNIEEVQYSIYRTEYLDSGQHNYPNARSLQSALEGKDPVAQGNFRLPHNSDYQRERVEVGMPPLESGKYIAIIQDAAEVSETSDYLRWTVFQVSSLFGFKSLNDLLVVDRESGKARQGVKVDVLEARYISRQRKTVYDLRYSGQTDDEGLFKTDAIEMSRGYFYRITDGGDTLVEQSWTRSLPDLEKELGPRRDLQFFLDRSIYRPGQTVYFKGVASQSRDRISSKPVVNRAHTLTVRDANRREVHRIEVRTNEYGTFYGSFTIPDGLTGSMTIADEDVGWASFRVEEYKRPTFFAEIDELEGEYQLGDTIKVSGMANAYAGFPVRNATVRYHVERRVSFPWWVSRDYFIPPFYREAVNVDFGEVKSDQKGEFSFTFATERIEDLKECDACRYEYSLSVDVLDEAGELRSASKVFVISRTSVEAKVSLPDRLDVSDEMSARIELNNLDGQPLNRRVNIRWAKLIPPSNPLLPRLWQEPTQFLMTEAEFKEKFPHLPYQDEDEPDNWFHSRPLFEETRNIEGFWEMPLSGASGAGMYRLEIVDAEAGNQRVLYRENIPLSDLQNEKTPGVKPLEAILNQLTFQPGDDLQLLLGSSFDGIQLYRALDRGNYSVENQWFSADRKNISIAGKIAEEDRGIQYHHFAGVRKGRLLTHTAVVRVPFENKKINIEVLEADSMVLPGSRQNLKFRLTDHNGQPLEGEVLASMYDKSLDDILDHQWDIGLYFERRPVDPLNRLIQPLVRGRGHDRMQRISISEPVFPTLKSKISPAYFLGSDMGLTQSRMRAVEAESYSEEIVLKEEIMTTEDDLAMPDSELPLRENFDETVFFYPDIQSDSNGVFELDFVMGEAMTSWKLQILALTEDFKYGITEFETVTHSDFIVLPDWPRFLMQGDRLEFPVRVINNADHSIEGNLRIKISDALDNTDLTLQSVGESEIEFSINPEDTEVLFFDLRLPADRIGLLSIEVSGRTSDYADGEKRLLPLMTSQVFITKSNPLFLERGEHMESTIHLKKGTRPKLNRTTFEYTSDPLWLAFKTLPFTSGERADNAMQYFEMYYTHAFAKHMLAENPILRSTIKKWAETDGLISELMKNEDLKIGQIEDSPWLRDALAQSRSRERLTVLLNENQVDMELSRLERKLQELQLEDGSFSWFPGGPSNWFVTQELLIGYGRLHQAGAATRSGTISSVVRKALAYAENRAKKEFNDRYVEETDKENGDRRLINNFLVQYLYLKTLLEPWATDFEEWDGMYKLAKEDWAKLSPRLQAMLGLVFYHQGDEPLFRTVAESLYERSAYEKNLGRFMPVRYSYTWDRMPLETQSSLVELWSQMEGMEEAVEQTQKWILNHRRTNNWGAGSTTARAIESLLAGRGVAQEYERPDEIRINGQPFPSEHTQPEAGSYYFKESVVVDEDQLKIEVKNHSNSISWGALYHQYFEEISNVEKDTSEKLPISIDRKWMVEEMTDQGPVQRELEEGTILRPGQTLVARIYLKSDRQMQYIHLRDLRPPALEPGNVLSGYRYKDGLLYYLSSRDASTDFYIENLPRGTFVLEYKTTVNYAGRFNSGLIKAQSYFAPEFVTYGSGGGLIIERD